ncbi:MULTISPECIES: DUF6916 family protein [Burkholderia]|uniref:DUF6916 domain-containing protein n=1 Tax=Burkholderia gladioli TaxID=28095 RepID=A0AB38TX70_BURGA|nr:hypothetical protein [Burkholderia gladioli]NBI48670.1 hypothetical protein [Burkholderia sp. ISTR5]AYQ91785.1 hypothetical protein EDD84_31430 [Burkholderia gladioli]KGE10192.1 hypothetical protein LA03_11590 [Burkholderia gladioli]KVM72118.1 hypothetical protein WJ59_05035 [Burkholderia gladioli]MBU9265050.1 hypothetical protein [Burkholderia gladioli]
MSVLPTHDELVQLLGQVLTIETADEAALPLTQTRLTDAPAGLPMDNSYDCYLAHFELPANVRLPQDTYRFRVPDGRHWLLFVSPTRPLASGAGTLCAVIHRKKSDDQAATGLATPHA